MILTIKNRIVFSVAVFLTAALLSFTPSFAQDAPAPVSVKIGVHATYTRVVFEFPKLLAYHPKASADGVEIIFDTKASLAIAPSKSPLIKKITTTPQGDDTQKVDINLASGATFKHYRLQRKIVVDIFPAAGGDRSPPAVAKAEPKKEPVATPAPVPAAPAVAVTAPIAAPVTATPAAKEVTPENSKTALTETKEAPPMSLAKTEESKPPEPKPVEQKAPESTPPLPETKTAAAPESEAEPTLPTVITFSSLSPMRLAVFERFGMLWIITDSTDTGGSPPAIDGPMASFIAPAKILKFEGGTAYRYTLPQKFYLQVKKQNLAWQISLLSAPATAPASNDMRIEVDSASRKAKLLAPLKGAGAVLTFEDPVVGDKLYIVPANQSDQAAYTARHMVDLEVLPALVGMVIRPMKDGVVANTVSDIVLITSPTGLTTMPESGNTPALIGADTATEEDGNRLFDFPNWRQGGIKKMQENKQKIQEKVAEALTPEERASQLMRLALLYFANNFGQEALGILELVIKETPEIEKNPDYIAVRGAARAMSGHYKEALQDLSLPAIQQHPEVSLWIGFAAAASEQWRMANRSFPKTNRLLLQYPDNIAIPFTIYMAESALHLGHSDTAEKLLNSINMTSDALDSHYRVAIDYLRGETYSQQNRYDEAAAVWEPVAKGLDRLYHTKASLALTRLLLQQKKITLKEAIERIDNLRFAWRGDGLEVSILHMLGSLKTQDNQILSGLQDLKQAADLAEGILDDPTEIQDEMRKIFADLFTGGLAEKISPLEAVSVYNEFSSLMPAGAEGSTASLNFADYLVRMDLLDRAAGLIEDQIKTGVMPNEKITAIGVKLAAIYLLDARPSQALEALKATERSALTDKDREERELLKARAQSQLNQTDAAIATLSALHSKNAQKLKADVLWRAQKWREAAVAIEEMLPTAGMPLSDEDGSFVINAAVAWKLSGDSGKLKQIKEKYEAALAPTKLAATFGVVTRDGGASALADHDSILQIAGEVDMFKSFLDSYKASGKGS